MYKDLIKVMITIKEHNFIKQIIIDNNSKDIILNSNPCNLNENEYNNFLDSFFTIIRFWNNQSYNPNNFLTIVITIIEKDRETIISVDKQIPDNYDSFLDLVNLLTKDN